MPIGSGDSASESADLVPSVDGKPNVARVSKRIIDVAIALPLGLLCLPWLVAIAAAIKCASRGPVFHSQVRMGQKGQPFRMWKFRTMVEDAERRLEEHLKENPEVVKEWNAGFKLKNDPRVIPWVGQLLRVSSVDELPQLWNVLSGEMSLVGPRPLPRYHLDEFDKDFRVLRESVPPGITGHWQVFSRDDGAPDMFRRWDTYYVVNWSLWLDFKILMLTPCSLLLGTRFRGLPSTDAAAKNL